MLNQPFTTLHHKSTMLRERQNVNKVSLELSRLSDHSKPFRKNDVFVSHSLQERSAITATFPSARLMSLDIAFAARSSCIQLYRKTIEP